MVERQLRHQFARIFFYTSSIATTAIAFLIIIATLWLVVVEKNYDLPEALTNWGGVIIGFYFGQVFGLLRELMVPGTSER